MRIKCEALYVVRLYPAACMSSIFPSHFARKQRTQTKMPLSSAQRSELEKVFAATERDTPKASCIGVCCLYVSTNSANSRRHIAPPISALITCDAIRTHSFAFLSRKFFLSRFPSWQPHRSAVFHMEDSCEEAPTAPNKWPLITIHTHTQSQSHTHAHRLDRAPLSKRKLDFRPDLEFGWLFSFRRFFLPLLAPSLRI